MKQTELVAIVAGANRGLGLETCRALARQGHRVTLSSRDQARDEQAAKQLAGPGLGVLSHSLDVRSYASIIWPATLRAGGPTGKFFLERREIDW